MAGKLKVAAVGCGGIGHLHQLGYLQHPGAELVAVCDIDAAKAQARAEDLNIAKWYPSIKEMLAHEECDLVDVVTADHLHFEPVMECLEAGKHVISEKTAIALHQRSRTDGSQSRRDGGSPRY